MPQCVGWLTPMNPTYYDEVEHLEIHGSISKPSGRLIWCPLESLFGSMLRAALLTNISLWRIKKRSMGLWRTWRSKGGWEWKEGGPSIWNQDDKAGSTCIYHRARVFCSDTNSGAKAVGNEHILWQMGESQQWKQCLGHIFMPEAYRDTTWCLETEGCARRRSMSTSVNYYCPNGRWKLAFWRSVMSNADWQLHW